MLSKRHGKQPKRRGGTLPAHVMMYFVVAMALFSDADYEAVIRKLVGPLRLWKSWDPSWTLPMSGGITRARKKLGFAPMKTLFERIAVPVASRLTLGAFCARRRLVSMDGMVFDLPDTEENTAEFGKPSGGVFPQARVVTLTECGSHVSALSETSSLDQRRRGRAPCTSRGDDRICLGILPPGTSASGITLGARPLRGTRYIASQ
jgi:hypothetical protein